MSSQPSLNHWWMPFTANSEFRRAQRPRLISAASGTHYVADDGRELIDGMCGLMCSPCGHSRPEIARAVAQQLEHMSYVPAFQVGHRLGFELSERLVAMAPAGLTQVFYGNSGSEAVETALKIALAYHRKRGEAQRTRLVGRERGYHGVNFGGMSVGGILANRDAFGQGLPGVVHLSHTWHPQHRFSDGQPKTMGREMADELEAICRKIGGHNIAACIVEPVAGSTGVLVPPVGYLERLREICNEHGILLIFDEVITGFGRLAAPFASQRFQVTPDLLVLAKGISNGAIPMGAVMVAERIYETLSDQGQASGIELFHGYTYSAHPAACAAALATLDIFDRECLIERAHGLEEQFQSAARSLRSLPVVTDVRGLGMMAGVDLEPLMESGKRGLATLQALYDAGVLVKFTADTMLIGPALVIEPNEITLLFERIGNVLADLA